MSSFVAFRKFISNEAGASIAEYSVLVAVMALGVALALTALGGAIAGLFTAVSGFINSLAFV